jgi:hypothetical protein
MSNAYARHLVIIPCAAAKVDHAAPAAELYASENFAHMLVAARAVAADHTAFTGEAAKVMILSAEHGLVELDQVLTPYDIKMGKAGCVGTELVIDQLVALAPASIATLLPSAYLQPVWEAVTYINEEGSDEDPWISLADMFEAGYGRQFGIGFQRGVASALTRLAA